MKIRSFCRSIPISDSGLRHDGFGFGFRDHTSDVRIEVSGTSRPRKGLPLTGKRLVVSSGPFRSQFAPLFPMHITGHFPPRDTGRDCCNIEC